MTAEWIVYRVERRDGSSRVYCCPYATWVQQKMEKDSRFTIVVRGLKEEEARRFVKLTKEKE